MSNYVLILGIVYSISVEAVPLNVSVGNSTTTYSTAANIAKPVTNYDAESSTTIKTNQKSENISKPVAHDDFLAFWASPLDPLDVLKKVSKFSKNDENAVIVSGSMVPDDVLASSNSKADDDGANNINNNQHETDNLKKYLLLNLFGKDDDELEPEYDAPNYDDYDGYNYDSNENDTNDEGDESDDSNESTDYKPYGDSEETDAENNNTNSNSDDHIKDEGDTNMKLVKEWSGNKTSAAFTRTLHQLHHIILWAVLLLNFNIEYI